MHRFTYLAIKLLASPVFSHLHNILQISVPLQTMGSCCNITDKNTRTLSDLVTPTGTQWNYDQVPTGQIIMIVLKWNNTMPQLIPNIIVRITFRVKQRCSKSNISVNSLNHQSTWLEATGLVSRRYHTTIIGDHMITFTALNFIHWSTIT